MEHTSDLETLAHCPICKADHLGVAVTIRDHFLTQEDFLLTDCKNCGFRSTNPRPTETIGRYYQSEQYISHSNRKKAILDHLYHFARRLALRTKYHLIRKHRRQGRVLDIGCGTGEFLAYLRGRGYKVEGIEPDLHAREQAIGNHGISVWPSISDMASREDHQVITMWHVLEHVPDLHETFKRIFSKLSGDGILVIAVPDRESWDSLYYGHHWAAWDVPRHLSHFRRVDVNRLLREHGFLLMETKRMWLDAFYIAILSERYKGRGFLSAMIRGLLMGSWSNLQALIKGSPTSSTLYIAKKA